MSDRQRLLSDLQSVRALIDQNEFLAVSHSFSPIPC